MKTTEPISRNDYGTFQEQRMQPVFDRLEAEAVRGERNGWTGYAKRRRNRLAQINRHNAIAGAFLGDGSGVGEISARYVMDMIGVHENRVEVDSWYMKR